MRGRRRLTWTDDLCANAICHCFYQLTIQHDFYTFGHMKQRELFKKEEKIYGGELRKKRKGRLGPRPLAVKSTMHLILRSSKAVGPWSFRKHHRKINAIVDKFATKYGVKIISLANVGNHLHLHIKLSNRFTYKAFIRAITAAIAMAVTGASRWNKLKEKFWDYRPFTRVVIGLRAFLNMRDYIRINQMEGQGYDRAHARLVVGEFAVRRASG
jgi:REP element-mobilizing transposase RayT